MAFQQLHQLVESAHVYTKHSEGRGNGLFASQDTAPKSRVIFVERPLLIALETSKLSTHCYTCLRSPEDSCYAIVNGGAPSLKICSGCKVVKFCDKKCQSQAWSQYHRLECKLYARLHPRVLPSAVRAITRLLKQHKAGMLTKGEWEELLALESHQQDMAKEGGERWQDFLLMIQGIVSYSGTNHTPDVILRLLCLLAVNSFALTNPTFDPIGMVLHPKPALFNHSCEPNAFVRFDVPASSRQPDIPTCGSISVYAVRSIAKDEEITLSYIDTTYPFDRRQHELRGRYFFTCSCDLCAKGPNSPRDHYLSPPPSTAIDIGNEAEHILLRVEAKPGLEHTQIDEIRDRMEQLANTGVWPLHRYPFPQLRQQLLSALLNLNRFPEALLQSAMLVRMTLPIMFEQDYDPTLLMHMWTFWNICGHCLGMKMQNLTLTEPIPCDVQMLGLLGCVVIDDMHTALSEGVRANGELEHVVDEAFEQVKIERAFWEVYQQTPEDTRQAVWLWMDGQLETLLRNGGVSQDIIDFSMKRQG
ncbi:uncharacterized protein Z518_04357 [Rhinocladiella mackenziei CBS 650.93]|uniref:Uncharacterized protein n=1 Tax=Rhinocladiella mackenziei CBS 650.93 TaxID=1442369 RepID=A0A0D2IT76_9EURO|nr:uncharacterized protein Z518_04357 [Rhinocladiella mackenziei CBS 650.93]KIX06381.1 hypothetical protein Z518_04357 [Rhinocladiella mackenziei CBS 650.93]